MNEEQLLNQVYDEVLEAYRNGSEYDLPPAVDSECAVIVANQERSKGVLAVLITLMLKKIASPEQDIRRHQDRMDGGFSGRGLDTRVVTPFMKTQNFPAMAESGWLTRSLEQPAPYTLDYPGGIRPAALKKAFLSIIDEVQRNGVSARQTLGHVLLGLIEFRERNSNIALDRPVGLSVGDTIDKIRRHHDVSIQGASRLPVLAIHAILSVLTRELDRYAGCEVSPLEHHNASDSRTRSIGDVVILDAEGNPFEGYEIKHNIAITDGLIRDSAAKFRTTPVRRYYILTTHIRDDYSEFDATVKQVADSHGCQLIVNGVDRTLMYYLRLIKGTRDFVNEYVSNLETDPSIGFDLKMAWNEIVQSR